ncbi:MAG TPA: DUF2905 domain-containing protein [Chitinophagaceae bacterium]|nr:DUF2905 domain-containing protein [Chitinophagaceae bacterium]
MMKQAGKGILVAGIILVLVGMVLMLFSDKLGWPGHLPGDIRIKKRGFTFFMPVTTMILISLFLSLLLWILREIKK